MRYWKHNIVGTTESIEESPRVYTTHNMTRLRRLTGRTAGYAKGDDQKTELDDVIENGVVVSPTRVSCNVVTVNSEISLRASFSSESVVITVVFPKLENLHQGKVSVLSALGRAVLGHRVGDEVEYTTPSGKRRITIDRILYQPEAMGHYRA